MFENTFLLIPDRLDLRLLAPFQSSMWRGVHERLHLVYFPVMLPLLLDVLNLEGVLDLGLNRVGGDCGEEGGEIWSKVSTSLENSRFLQPPSSLFNMMAQGICSLIVSSFTNLHICVRVSTYFFYYLCFLIECFLNSGFGSPPF